MVRISDYLNENLVVFLKAHTRDEAIQELVAAAHSAGKLDPIEPFFQAIIDREKVVTTGIGMGVAIPHAKLPILNDFFIVIGILKKGIDWKALDGALVRLIFMIGGPDDKQTEYLQILSSLTAVLKEESRRKRIAMAATSEEVIALLGVVKQ